jgi:hypothetical protein
MYPLTTYIKRPALKIYKQIKHPKPKQENKLKQSTPPTYKIRGGRVD